MPTPTPGSATFPLDKSSKDVIEYHAGWWIVAARRDLERSNDKSKLALCSLIPLFGKDIASLLRLCLENFSKLSVLAQQQSGSPPKSATADHMYACQPELPTNKEMKHTFPVQEHVLLLFHHLHTLAENSLKSLVTTEQHDAAKRLREILVKDNTTKDLFKAITSAESVFSLI